MGHQGYMGRDEAQKRYRDKSKKNGTCKDCSERVVEGKQQCQYHLDVNRRNSQKQRDSQNVQIASKGVKDAR